SGAGRRVAGRRGGVDRGRLPERRGRFTAAVGYSGARGGDGEAARTRTVSPMLTAAFADISIVQLLVIAFAALAASLVGGVAGYGTGALMPLVLVPIVGAEPVVPIIALSSLLTNGGRATAFAQFLDWR